MLSIILAVAVLSIALAVPVLDRLTQAPIMRRHVNDGTQAWRLRKRVSEREGSGLSELAPEDELPSDWIRARRRM